MTTMSTSRDRQDSFDNARISLSLNDLVSSNNADRANSYNQSGNTAAYLENKCITVDYKFEMNKILSKSKGTPYEATLKRFVDSKIKELNTEYSNVPLQTAAVSLATLSISKYDSPVRQSAFDNSSLFKTKNEAWLENMAQPLPRNTWKEPSTIIVSTNNTGRQRPAPEQQAINNAIFSASHSIRGGAGGNLAVGTSPSEFARWHKSNKAWQQNAADKVDCVRKESQKQVETQCQPCISTRSTKLADAVAKKIATQMLAANAARTASASQFVLMSTTDHGHCYNDETLNISQLLNHDSYNENDNPLKLNTRSMDSRGGDEKVLHLAPSEKSMIGLDAASGSPSPPQIPECLSLSTVHAIAVPTAINIDDVAKGLTVYDRLAWQSREFMEAKRNWHPPPPNDTFSPAICENSRRLALLVRSKQNKVEEKTTVAGGGGAAAAVSMNTTPIKPAITTHRSSRSLSPSPGPYAQRRRSFSRSQSPSPANISHGLYAHHTRSSSAQRRQGDDPNISKQQGKDGKQKERKKSLTMTVRLSDLLDHASASGAEEGDERGGHGGKGGDADCAAGIAVTGNSVRSGRSREKQTSSVSSLLPQSARKAEDDDDSSSVASSTYRWKCTAAELRAYALANVEKIRAASVDRAQKREKEQHRQMYTTSTKADVQPFQPTLAAARASHRIMTKINNTSFVDRNIKFEDTLLIRDAVCRRGGSPGPGHYNNVLNAPVSPTRSSTSVPAHVLRDAASSGRGPSFTDGSASSDIAQVVQDKRRSSSPSAGHRGYGFGKEELNREGRERIPFSPRVSAMLGYNTEMGATSTSKRSKSANRRSKNALAAATPRIEL